MVHNNSQDSLNINDSHCIAKTWTWILGLVSNRNEDIISCGSISQLFYHLNIGGCLSNNMLSSQLKRMLHFSISPNVCCISLLPIAVLSIIWFGLLHSHNQRDSALHHMFCLSKMITANLTD